MSESLEVRTGPLIPEHGNSLERPRLVGEPAILDTTDKAAEEVEAIVNQTEKGQS